jgi:hypothetical protein
VHRRVTAFASTRSGTSRRRGTGSTRPGSTSDKPRPVTDLFGAAGRVLLERLQVRSPGGATSRRAWSRSTTRKAGSRRSTARHAAHPDIPLPVSAAGIGRGARLHDRRRDRRDRAVPLAPRSSPATPGLRPRVNQSGDKDRRGPPTTHGPPTPLGDARGHQARAKAPRLRRALPAQRAPARQTARSQDRPDRHRPPTHPHDPAHAFPQPAVRSHRRRWSSGGPTAHFGIAPPQRTIRFRLILPRGGHRNMSTAPHHRPTRGPDPDTPTIS